MFGLGIWELMIVLAIVVLLFGAKRLPMIGEGVGKMLQNFKKATHDENASKDEKKEDPSLLASAAKESN